MATIPVWQFLVLVSRRTCATLSPTRTYACARVVQMRTMTDRQTDRQLGDRCDRRVRRVELRRRATAEAAVAARVRGRRGYPLPPIAREGINTGGGNALYSHQIFPAHVQLLTCKPTTLLTSPLALTLLRNGRLRPHLFHPHHRPQGWRPHGLGRRHQQRVVRHVHDRLNGRAQLLDQFTRA